MTDPTPAASEVIAEAAPQTGGIRLWHRLRRRPTFWLSAVILFFVALLLFVPGLVADAERSSSLTGGCQLANSLLPPSGAHWFGTDQQGCDIYTLTVFGARPSIVVALLGTISAIVIGSLVGLIAGFYGRWVDALLSRIIDIFYGLPLILGGIVLLSALDLPGIWGVVVLLAVLGWVPTARMVRATTLAAKNADFAVSARALGVSNGRLLFRHLYPNSYSPLLVLSVLGLGAFIAAEATFSYLGLGIRPPEFSWGTLISDAQDTFFVAPWTLLFPAGFLTLTVLGFVLMGEAIRAAFDPKESQ